MLEGRRHEVPLQSARVEVEPARGGVGESHGRHPLVFQAPRGQCPRVHRQRRQQGVQRKAAAQVHAPDAGDRLDGAQWRVQVLCGMARQHDRYRRFAPGKGFVRGRIGLLVRAACCTAAVALRGGFRFHDAHRLQRRLAVLRRLGGDVEQDQRAGFHVLQLQPRGRNRLARPQVDRAARTLHAQVVADAGRHADAHIAVDEDQALLADHQRHRQGQALPAQDFHGLAGRHETEDQQDAGQGRQGNGLHGESPCRWPEALAGAPAWVGVGGVSMRWGALA